MKASDYIKARTKMTKDCTIYCEICPLYQRSEYYGYFSCCEFEKKKPEEAEWVVENWYKNNNK